MPTTLRTLERQLATLPATERPDVLRLWRSAGGQFLDAPFSADADCFESVCGLLLEDAPRWVARLVAEATWPLSEEGSGQQLYLEAKHSLS